MGEQDRAQARIDGLLDALRNAEADFRQSYFRVLGVVNQPRSRSAWTRQRFSPSCSDSSSMRPTSYKQRHSLSAGPIKTVDEW